MPTPLPIEKFWFLVWAARLSIPKTGTLSKGVVIFIQIIRRSGFGPKCE
jgi:hypothetical protein